MVAGRYEHIKKLLLGGANDFCVRHAGCDRWHVGYHLFIITTIQSKKLTFRVLFLFIVGCLPSPCTAGEVEWLVIEYTFETATN